MSEAVLCFDLKYAADLTLFAMAAFGELTGPRASDFHIALRLHFEFDGQVLVWARFAGKNNQQVKRRRRVYVKEQGDSLLTRRFITERESTGRTAKEPLAFLLPPAQRHGLQRARGGTRCTVCSPTATSWRAHLWA